MSASQPSVAEAFNTVRVLVVGEATDADVRRVADTLLNLAGTTLAAGDEATELLSRLDVDLIVADEGSDGHSGPAFLNAAAAIRPTAALFLLQHEANRNGGPGSPDIVVLTKPVDVHAVEMVSAMALRSAALKRSMRTLELENQRLRLADSPNGDGLDDEVGELESYEGILTRSPVMLSVVRTLEELAGNNVTVLIQGETGTGKELVARAIHARSRQNCGPFVAVNLGAVPNAIRESELFGHVRGAFTGASESRGGRFVEANHGCLFLDEVGEAPPGLQVALLRVLEEGTITPVGADRPRRVDVRILSATNRPLEELVRAGRFRRDLYYRLNVFSIKLPPLRERPEDIFPLANHFLDQVCRRLGRKPAGISRDARRALEGYRWEGNVRELRNVMERAAIVSRGGLIVAADLPVSIDGRTDPPVVKVQRPLINFPPGGATLMNLEREIFRKTLALADGNQSRAARMLGLHESTFRFRMRKLGIAEKSVP